MKREYQATFNLLCLLLSPKVQDRIWYAYVENRYLHLLYSSVEVFFVSYFQGTDDSHSFIPAWKAVLLLCCFPALTLNVHV